MLPEIRHFLFIGHLDKNVHSCSLEPGYSFEISEPVDDVDGYSLVSKFFLFSCSIFPDLGLEPRMVECSFAIESLLWVCDQKTLDQVLTFVRNDLKLLVVEVEIGVFYFVKYFF